MSKSMEHDQMPLAFNKMPMGIIAENRKAGSETWLFVVYKEDRNLTICSIGTGMKK
jgi:hypothetical protein